MLTKDVEHLCVSQPLRTFCLDLEPHVFNWVVFLISSFVLNSLFVLDISSLSDMISGSVGCPIVQWQCPLPFSSFSGP